MGDLPPVSARHSRFQAQFRLEYVIAGGLLLIAALVVIAFFERIPIEGTMLAIDWQHLYSGIRGGHIVYEGGSLMIAPWSLPAVLPLGLFSMRAGWGMLALLIVCMLIASVPRRGRRLDLLAIALLVSSFLALRQIVDGNFEVLVIAGVALVIYGYRHLDRGQGLLIFVVGLLLATAKPQEVWLLMIVLGVYLLRTRPLRQLAELGTVLAVIVIPALILFGTAWVGAMRGIQPPPGSILDISLWAALARLGVGPMIAALIWVVLLAAVAYVALWSRPTLSREKAGMLIAASLLLSPYAAGDSVLTVLAIGIIPMLQTRFRLALALIAVIDLQYILPRDFLYWNGAYYWTTLLILVVAIWAWQLYRSEVHPTKINKEYAMTPNS